MAADSAAILQGDVKVGQTGKTQRQIIQTFTYATKVSQVKDYPMGLMTWGLGSLNSRSIQSLVMEWEYAHTTTSPFVMQTVADDLLAFIAARYDKAFPSPTADQTLGLFVGGYSDNEFFSSQYKCEFPTERTWQLVRPDKAKGQPDFGVNWFGATDALQRLILGFDPAGLQKLIDRGADKAIIQAWVDDRDSSLPLVFDGMPLQDAIDFAQWAAQVVIGRWRFGPGAQLVGGDVDVAVIRPGSLDWAERKRWSIKG